MHTCVKFYHEPDAYAARQSTADRAKRLGYRSASGAPLPILCIQWNMPNDYQIFPYNRERAVAYAQKWAFRRNPAFFDFSDIGGDCTNFASQCVYAGAGAMNFTPVFGWFYRSANDRTASWTGVEYLYNFLTSNEGAGPFAEEVPLGQLERGDLVQLGRLTGDFYHTPIVVSVSGGNILVAAHSYDAYGKALASYNAPVVRGLHILGVRRAP